MRMISVTKLLAIMSEVKFAKPGTVESNTESDAISFNDQRFDLDVKRSVCSSGYSFSVLYRSNLSAHPTGSDRNCPF